MDSLWGACLGALPFRLLSDDVVFDPHRVGGGSQRPRLCPIHLWRAGHSIGLATKGSQPLRFHFSLTATPWPQRHGIGHIDQDRRRLGHTTARGWYGGQWARFYGTWLKNHSGVLVPVGTFYQGPDVQLWAGVFPQNFPTFTITEQTTHGNPASSGLPVLVGLVTS